jgi:hypothetical protein
VAQDPGVREGDKVLMAEVEIPAESLSSGPRGHRISVVDYDASTDTLYSGFAPADLADDPFGSISFDEMLVNPQFHSWNVYAVAMRTLTRFEFALGRKVAWSHEGHQLKIFPHAFRDTNAFYAPEAEALMFGYFQGKKNTIFSCLAHDVVAHEMTHAVIDGLRSGFMIPSSPDQAAFHEGFADVVALLEVLSLPEVVRAILENNWSEAQNRPDQPAEQIEWFRVTERQLLETDLFGLAVEMGKEMSASRGDALRRSVMLEPDEDLLELEEWSEPHRRGEILSAIMLKAFVNVWMERISRLRKLKYGRFDIGSVADEGAEAASMLLTTAMRAIDYTPPIHLTFSDFRSALLTADYELRPEIDKYNFRQRLREAFDAFGVPSAPDSDPSGRWVRESDAIGAREVDYGRSRFEGMQRDPDEVFRFAWENRNALGFVDEAYTKVASIRPAVRIAPEDGALLRETVVEIIQQIEVQGRELASLGMQRPQGMTLDQPIVLQGGATLIFDDYGHLKYRIRNALPHPKLDANHDPRIARLNSSRLREMWIAGDLDERGRSLGSQRLRDIHLRKSTDDEVLRKEQW